MANYTIRDLERLSGIKAHTIRIWEKRYGLIEPQRTNTNIRTYCDDELKKILNISILNRNGIKISKIAELSSDEMSKKVNQITSESSDSEIQLENLTLAMIEMNEHKFEKILSRSIIQMGFEETVIQVLYPFFIRIGVMWQTGSVNVAQEHFISNLVRQKMIVAIDSQIVDETPQSKSFLLFLPESEWHELGLLFFAYLIRKRGHRILYLGQSVPRADLMAVVDSQQFDYLLTSVVASRDDDFLNDYLYPVVKSLTEKHVFISGYQAQFYTNLPQNVTYLASPNDFVEALGRIAPLI